MTQSADDINAGESELRKGVQCQWIDTIGTGIMAVGFVVLFFIPVLRDWQLIVPIGLAGLMLLRRTLATGKDAGRMRTVLLEAKRQAASAASAPAGSWPPPPKRPAA